MATSRLERIGTIYSRVEGLLRSKAMRPEDRPIWWDIYRAFPPAREPIFAHPPPTNTNITPIFYKEDVIRAKYHKSGEAIGTVILSDTRKQTNSQQFIEIYNNLKADNNEDKEIVFDKAVSALKQSRDLKKDEWMERKARETENKPRPTFTENRKASTNIHKIFDDE